MSYILEALKKAERERNRAKVPTLLTVHIPVYATRRWIVLWAAMVVLLSGGALVWFWRVWPPAERAAPVEPRPQVAVAPAGKMPNPESLPASTKTTSLPPLAGAASTPLAPSASPASPRPEPNREVPKRSRLSLPVVRPAPHAVVPPSEPTQPKEAQSEAVPAPPTAPTATSPGASVSQTPERETANVAPAGPTSTGPLSLRDALPKLTLDMLVYTEAEADRIAVINGRRYVKGQRIDGLYLVEGIAPEGVVLSYQGEKAVLRP